MNQLKEYMLTVTYVTQEHFIVEAESEEEARENLLDENSEIFAISDDYDICNVQLLGDVVDPNQTEMKVE